eukprot:m.271593 g.271593  ORF g.271593 m.271593 type:complete len:231 (-) comp15683_c8_seq4:527-1219(-)
MSVLLVALAVLALAIVVIAIVFLRGKSIKRDSILLVGLSNGGKTQLFSLLTTGKLASNTFTSLKPNEGAINFPDKEQPVPLVDVPGHHRLQRVNLEQYAPQAMAVVVVVDAASFSKTKREVAEFMYDVLTTFEKSQIPLLVVCNKQDNLLAQRCAVIESDIESEVSDLRHTRRYLGCDFAITWASIHLPIYPSIQLPIYPSMPIHRLFCLPFCVRIYPSINLRIDLCLSV